MAIGSSFNSGFSSAISGLNIASKQVNVSASNIVGASAVDSLPLKAENYQGYTPQDLNVTSSAEGVVTGVVSDRSPAYIEGLNASFEPTAFPNVDITQEIVNMTKAETAYKASAKALKILQEMSKKALDISS